MQGHKYENRHIDGQHLLDIEIQMARKFQFPSQNFLVDPKRVVVKEGRVPVERNQWRLKPGPTEAAHPQCANSIHTRRDARKQEGR